MDLKSFNKYIFKSLISDERTVTENCCHLPADNEIGLVVSKQEKIVRLW